ncbi:MAG: tetratricopeptide repeat protein [Cyanobacteria bacterium HKST-UBA02]|nr:tetratricopeptide repeat protein [Cyanobacteria bacterium HKST-UBA02]
MNVSSFRRSRSKLLALLLLLCPVLPAEAKDANESSSSSTVVSRIADEAHLLLKSGNFRRALAKYRILVGLRPEKVDYYFGMYDSALRAGDWKQATLALDKLCGLNPEYREGLDIEYSACLYQQGLFEEADGLLVRAFESDGAQRKKFPELNHQVSASYFRFSPKRVDLYLDYLRRKAERDPEKYKKTYEAARHYFESRKQGRVKERAPVEEEDDFTGAVASQAPVTLSSVQAEEATARRRSYEAHRYLCNIYLAQKKRDEAKGEFGALLALRPDDSDIALEYGTFLAHYGEFQAAIPYLELVVKKEPGRVEANGALGLSLLRLKRYKDACPYLRRAARLDPARYGSTYQDLLKYLRGEKNLLIAPYVPEEHIDKI